MQGVFVEIAQKTCNYTLRSIHCKHFRTKRSSNSYSDAYHTNS